MTPSAALRRRRARRDLGAAHRAARPGGPGESGSAVVEFVFLAILLVVPLLYLVMTLARVQAGAFAVSMAAREAGRAYVTSDSQAQAAPRARAAARLAFEDQGFGTEQRERLDAARDLVLSCDATPCLRPGGRLEVTATVVVPLPLVPALARDVVPLEVRLSATHLAVVDRFRAIP